MKPEYSKAADRAFGKLEGPSAPNKRPVQARSRFTVQAIYDGLVRIFQRDGWSGVSIRSLSVETGYAVGTIYDYFPDREAVLSGYVRHALQARYTRIATLPTAETWQTRVRQLVVATVGTAEPGSPPILPEIAHLEHRIADNTHHRRVYEELVAAWTIALAECPDLPTLPDARLRRLVLIAWGAFRYAWLAAPDELKTGAYVDEVSDLLIAALDPNCEVAG